jgi:histidinol dehydrogenase
MMTPTTDTLRPTRSPRLIDTTHEDFAATFKSFCEARADFLLGTGADVGPIVEAVRTRGDAALVEFTAKFDRRSLTPAELEVPHAVLHAAVARIPADLRASLELAIQRVRAFHEHQRETGFLATESLARGEIAPHTVRPLPHGAEFDGVPETGIQFGQVVLPLERVGIYVPGGTAAYPSSLIMAAVPAKVAGVREVVCVSPAPVPPDAPAGFVPTIPDVILATAALCGVDRFFCVGGAQAVAALAFGTESVPRVDKIVGPGNIYVAAAKRYCYGRTDIDMVAGPSEVCIVAAGDANPAWIAADLLAQAEHDAHAGTLLLTPEPGLAQAVADELDLQLARLPRAVIAGASIAHGLLVTTQTLDEAIELANTYAPEHLELAFEGAHDWLWTVRNAGTVFLGEHTPEALGDYLGGINHVLPTSGSARFFPPLGVYSFTRRMSFMQCGAKALATLGPRIVTLAESESLTAHAQAVKVRRTP